MAESGKFNMDRVRIPIASGLNLVKWPEYVHKYADVRLLQFYVYGFPLGIQLRAVLCINEG